MFRNSSERLAPESFINEEMLSKFRAVKVPVPSEDDFSSRLSEAWRSVEQECASSGKTPFHGMPYLGIAEKVFSPFPAAFGTTKHNIQKRDINSVSSSVENISQENVDLNSKVPKKKKLFLSDSRSSILNQIPYQYGRMLLAWRCGSETQQKVPELLCQVSHEYQKVPCKSFTSIAWDENTFLPPGFVLKFGSPSEAVNAHKGISLKLRENLKTLRLDELVQAMAELESSHPSLRSSMVVIRNKRKLISVPDTRELESLLSKFGDIISLHYPRKEVGSELLCEIQYACLTQGFLSVMALDNCYLPSLGGLNVRLQKRKTDWVLLSRVAELIHKCLGRI